jgi:hypothetical protein
MSSGLPMSMATAIPVFGAACIVKVCASRSSAHSLSIESCGRAFQLASWTK